MKIYREKQVVIVGGGTAGLVAALAAARNGADTIIVEQQGFLGGTMTGSLLPHMQTFHDASGNQIVKGLAQEIVDRLIEAGGAIGHLRRPPRYWGTDTPYDAEVMKYVAEQMVQEAGVEVLYHTFCADVLKSGPNLKGICVENKTGRQLILAKVFVDATGDGDVSVRAGAPFEMGRSADNLCQSVSYQFQLANVDLDRFAAYLQDAHAEVEDRPPEESPDPGANPSDVRWEGNVEFVKGVKPGADKESYVRLIGKMPTREVETGNIPPEYARFTVESIHDGFAIVGHPHVNKVDATDTEQLTRANMLGRKRVWELTHYIKQHVPGFENAFIVQTPPFIGVRETRRILGEYLLTLEDVRQGRQFDDSIAVGAFPIDIHPIDRLGPKTSKFEYLSAPYGVPYRCLVPKHVENLLVAGRCISASHEANASVRVTPTCMAIGQAAGTAAAISAGERVSPRRLDIAKLRSVLRTQGAVLASHPD